MRAGVHGIAPRIRAAESRLRLLQGTPAEEGAARKLRQLQAEMGWTQMTGGTIPGAARSLATQPGRTMRLGWQSMGPFEKSLLVGFGGKSLYDIGTAGPEQFGPGREYKSRLQALGSELGGDLAWIAGGPLSLVPSIAAFTGGGLAGEVPGRLLAARMPGSVG